MSFLFPIKSSKRVFFFPVFVVVVFCFRKYGIVSLGIKKIFSEMHIFIRKYYFPMHELLTFP